MRLRVLGLLALLCAGCGKTITEEDCRKVAGNLREVWLAEAKKAAPADGSAADKANAVIKAGADKLVADWSSECKKELEGRRVDSKEMDCLLAAKSHADVNKCAGL
jgi:hypothetical protein